MPSQSSQPPGPVTLSLSKFSYATVSADSTAPIPWIHLSDHGGLFATFDVIRLYSADGGIDEHTELKIVNEAERLDTLRLDTLAREARRTQDGASTTTSSNSYSTTLIVRAPCLAIRYPLAERKVRRIQMRFAQEADYYQAMQFLSQAGCPLTNAATNPTLRPQTRPLSAASTLVNVGDYAPNRPITALSASGDLSRVHHAGDLRDNLPRSVLNQPNYYQDITGNHGCGTGQPEGYQMGRQYQFPYVQPSMNDDQGATHFFDHRSSNTWGDHRSQGCQDSNQRVSSSADRKLNIPLGSITATSENDPSLSFLPAKLPDIGDILYTPRPYTAPSMPSQGTMDRIMPPPRSLPFKKNTTRIEYKVPDKGDNQDIIQSSSNEHPVEAVVTAAPNSILDPHADVSANESTIAKRTRNAGRKKSPKPPRKRTATSKRKNASQNDAPSIPTVDEILERDKNKETPESSEIYGDRSRRGLLLARQDPLLEFESSREPVELQLNRPGALRKISGSQQLTQEEPVNVAGSTHLNGSLERHETTSVPGNTCAISASAISPPRKDAPDSATLQTMDLSSFNDNGHKSKVERLASMEEFFFEQLENPNFRQLVMDMETWYPRLLVGEGPARTSP